MARDDAEYVEFVAAVQDGLRRTAYLLTGDWEVATDAAQATLVELYVAWPRLGRCADVAAYARRTLVARTVERERRRPLRSAVTSGGAATAAGALRRLPPRQRACVVLSFFEELSTAETAAAVGCSEREVRYHRSRGVAALRRDLDLPDAPARAAVGGAA